MIKCSAYGGANQVCVNALGSQLLLNPFGTVTSTVSSGEGPLPRECGIIDIVESLQLLECSTDSGRGETFLPEMGTDFRFTARPITEESERGL